MDRTDWALVVGLGALHGLIALAWVATGSQAVALVGLLVPWVILAIAHAWRW